MTRKCNWKQEPDWGSWETDCGNSFDLYDGGPSDNYMNFCCYCGKLLTEEAWEEPPFPDDDDN